MGAICARGNGVKSAFSAVKRGEDGLKTLSIFDSKLKTAPLCAQVEIDLDKITSPGLYRTLGLALAAVNEALLPMPDRKGIRLGVVTATTVGGICTTERVYERFRLNPGATVPPGEIAVHEPTVLSSNICAHVGGCGFHTISTACSTGLHAVGMAKRLIEKGDYDACLAVGSDALSLLTIRGFASLTLLDPQGCRPFDKRRAGISLGEGAGAILLTSSEIARKFGIKYDSVVSGWGASADCYHMTAPHPEGEGAVRAVKAALREAELDAGKIDMIAAHGTGTPDNDKAEVKAMKTVFGTVPPICSMKRTLGHTLAASGILEAVISIRCLEQGVIPPTAGFEEVDEEIGLEPSEYMEKPINHLLKNSFGFGGNNATIIFSKAEKVS